MRPFDEGRMNLLNTSFREALFNDGGYFLPLSLNWLKVSHISATSYTAARLGVLRMSLFLLRVRRTVELT